MLTLTQTSRRFSALHDLHRETRREAQLRSAKGFAALPTLTTLWIYLATVSALLQLSLKFYLICFFKQPLTFFLSFLEIFGDSNMKPHGFFLTNPPRASP